MRDCGAQSCDWLACAIARAWAYGAARRVGLHIEPLACYGLACAIARAYGATARSGGRPSAARLGVRSHRGLGQRALRPSLGSGWTKAWPESGRHDGVAWRGMAMGADREGCSQANGLPAHAFDVFCMPHAFVLIQNARYSIGT